MRLDHIAYRVTDRNKTAEFLTTILDYSKATEFQIEFDDKSTAQCIVLEPVIVGQPEVFISNGSPGSIVDKWVKERNGGGVHHIAYSLVLKLLLVLFQLSFSSHQINPMAFYFQYLAY